MEKELKQSKTDISAWVGQYADPLFAYALARTGRGDVAEDLVQETFLAALKSGDGFRQESAALTWLTGILRHKILDYYRGLAKKSASLTEEQAQSHMDRWFDEKGMWKTPPKSWASSPSDMVENEEFWQTFHHCLDALPVQSREAFVRRMMDEEETKIICKEMALTQTNLWVILHRGRALLRDCLEKNWFMR